jgi:hypothetical protein
MERKILHTLHGHVLEGMRRRSETGPYEQRPIKVTAAGE